LKITKITDECVVVGGGGGLVKLVIINKKNHKQCTAIRFHFNFDESVRERVCFCQYQKVFVFVLADVLIKFSYSKIQIR
jgi:hypothetical protein